MKEGSILWEPTAELLEHSAMARFMRDQGQDGESFEIAERRENCNH